MILVSGAAGKTGLAVIAALLAKEQAVRALVKDMARAQRVREAGAAEVVSGDMGDPAVWQRAFEGIRAVYHIGPNMHPAEEQFGFNALAAARKADVERFVYHSVLHPQTEAMPHHWRKLRVEEKILESGLNFTVLQPAVYMQNLVGGWEAIVAQGVYRAPYPVSTRLSLVDLQDVAQVAAQALTEAGHAGATYQLVGTEPLSQTEVADQLATALGGPVRAEEISHDAWRAQVTRDGIPAHTVESLLKMFRYYADFGFPGNARVLTWLLGRPPRTLEDFVRSVSET